MPKECAVTSVIHQQTSLPPDPQRGISLDEWMRLLSAGRYEVIDGEVIKLSPPTLMHIRIAHRLFRSMDPVVQEGNLGELWLEAPYVLDEDDRTNWVYGSKLPDVSFVERKRFDECVAKFGEKGPIRLAPDLVIEIVSPNDSYTEVNEKIANYLRYGVQLAIIVDAQQRVIRTHTPEVPDGRTLYDGDTLTTDPVIPGWSATVADILGAPPPAYG
jgi:Uma2 family endonuclease